jgi:hypothetical protein
MNEVTNSTDPDNKSKQESKNEAITDTDPLEIRIASLAIVNNTLTPKLHQMANLICQGSK